MREDNIIETKSNEFLDVRMVEFLINKHIAVLMTALNILILETYDFGFIPVSLMPDIDIPDVPVQVYSENMSAR